MPHPSHPESDRLIAGIPDAWSYWLSHGCRILAFYAAIAAVLFQIATWILSTTSVVVAWVAYCSATFFGFFLILGLLSILINPMFSETRMRSEPESATDL